MNSPAIAWSHSRINAYLTCPRRMFEVTIAKNWSDSFGPEADWGKKVHKALERRLMLGAELPANMVQYEGEAKNVEAMHKKLGGQMLCEQQMAVTQTLKPCGWFDKQTWGRCITDVTLVNTERGSAVAIDWKTGKKKDDDRQLALQAAFIFRHYPTVDRVTSAFIWLKEGIEDRVSGEDFTRTDHLNAIELDLGRRLTRMGTAWREEVFQPKESGLCRGWCPVEECFHWKPKKGWGR